MTTRKETARAGHTRSGAGALPPHPRQGRCPWTPALLADGGHPNVVGYRGRGISVSGLPGAAEPPARSRAPTASHAMALRATLEQAAEPGGAASNARRGDAPQPAGKVHGDPARTPDSHTVLVFEKTRNQKDHLVLEGINQQSYGKGEEAPREQDLGEPSLHRIRCDPVASV